MTELEIAQVARELGFTNLTSCMTFARVVAQRCADIAEHAVTVAPADAIRRGFRIE